MYVTCQKLMVGPLSTNRCMVFNIFCVTFMIIWHVYRSMVQLIACCVRGPHTGQTWARSRLRLHEASFLGLMLYIWLCDFGFDFGFMTNLSGLRKDIDSGTLPLKNYTQYFRLNIEMYRPSRKRQGHFRILCV